MLDSGQTNCFLLSPIFRSWKTSFQSWKGFVGTFSSVLRRGESGQNAWLLWKVCLITPPSFSGKDRLLGRNIMQLVMYELPAERDQGGCESQWHFLRKGKQNPPPWCPAGPVNRCMWPLSRMGGRKGSAWLLWCFCVTGACCQSAVYLA